MGNRIINRRKGIITDKEFEGLYIDYADVYWYDSGKRIQKLVTRKGENIGVRLDGDSIIRGLLQGDVLEVKGDEAIVVNIIEEKCIAVKMNDLRTVAKVSYEIGNRHAPLFYSEDDSELVMPYDKPMLEMLKKLEVEVQVKTMKIHRNKSISSVHASHDHEHIHHHSHEHDQSFHHNHEHEQSDYHSHNYDQSDHYSNDTEHRHCL